VEEVEEEEDYDEDDEDEEDDNDIVAWSVLILLTELDLNRLNSLIYSRRN